MAFPAICSPRSARLLLTGSVDLPTFAVRTVSDTRLVVKEPPIYFPGLKPLARPWRLAPWLRPHVDDLEKKNPAGGDKQFPLLVPRRRGCQASPSAVSLHPRVARLPVLPPPVPILKRTGTAVKQNKRHVSFGDVVVHEVERFPWRVFPPPRFAVFEPKRRSFPPRVPSPPPVEELPRRVLQLEVTVRGPTLGQWIGCVGCCIAAVSFLSWLR